jgi:hypothetical protein
MFWKIDVTSSAIARVLLLGCATWSLNVAIGQAAPQSLPLSVQSRISKGIVQGVYYLKLTQQPDGTWPSKDKNHPVGHAALPALTLLECGVSHRDPVIQLAAAYVRSHFDKLDNTYDLALAILFLDRLGAYNEEILNRVVEGSIDRRLIEIMSLRLIAAQTTTGGWSYGCPVLEPDQHARLLKALRQPKVNLKTLPASLRKMAVFQDPAKLMVKPSATKTGKSAAKGALAKAPEPTEPTTDNSNTQFAILALWVAQRYNVPIERSVKLLAKRFRTSQNPDGSWGYEYHLGSSTGGGPAMTCAGLLGLAIEHGFAPTVNLAKPPAELPAAPLAAGAVAIRSLPSFFLALKAAQDANAKRTQSDKDARDSMIANALQALGKNIGQPTGRFKDVPLTQLYFLWSVERVGMLYNLTTIGDKDWYRWGMEMIVANQNQDGRWDAGASGYGPTVDTSFALLFLRQTNLADDLTDKLQVDPRSFAKPQLEPGDDAQSNRIKVAPGALGKGNAPGLPSPPLAVPDAKKPERPPATGLAKASPSNLPDRPVGGAPPPLISSPPPAPAPTVPSTPTPARAEKKNDNALWLWAGGGAAGLLLAGSIVLLVMSRRAGDDSPTRSRNSPRKKQNKQSGDGRVRKKGKSAGSAD